MNMLQTVRARNERRVVTSARAGGDQDRIRTADAPDEDAVLAALTRAFLHDPAVRWLYPDTGQYLRWFPRFARAFGGKALALGTAHCIDGYAGCALWLPPGAGPDEEAVVDVVVRSVAPDRQDEVFALLEVMGQAHPQDAALVPAAHRRGRQPSAPRPRRRAAAPRARRVRPRRPAGLSRGHQHGKHPALRTARLPRRGLAARGFLPDDHRDVARKGNGVGVIFSGACTK